MLYFDTSFLAPLIVEEATSKKIEAFFVALPVGRLHVSQWTRVEFASLIAREFRMGGMALAEVLLAMASSLTWWLAPARCLFPARRTTSLPKRTSSTSRQNCKLATRCIWPLLATMAQRWRNNALHPGRRAAGCRQATQSPRQHGYRTLRRQQSAPAIEARERCRACRCRAHASCPRVFPARQGASLGNLARQS